MSGQPDAYKKHGGRSYIRGVTGKQQSVQHMPEKGVNASNLRMCVRQRHAKDGQHKNVKPTREPIDKKEHRQWHTATGAVRNDRQPRNVWTRSHEAPEIEYSQRQRSVGDVHARKRRHGQENAYDEGPPEPLTARDEKPERGHHRCQREMLRQRLLKRAYAGQRTKDGHGYPRDHRRRLTDRHGVSCDGRYQQTESPEETNS